MADPSARRRLLEGADTVLHLATAVHPRSDRDACLAELGRMQALVDDAAAAGVRRIVYASSVHAMGLYNRAATRPVRSEWPPSPCCPYGAGKAAAESYLRMRAHRFDSVVVLRLGLTGWGRGSVTDDGLYLSDADAGRLLTAALTSERNGFHACFGTSANTARHWDLSTAVELGYRPVDDSVAIAPTAVDPDDGECRLKGDRPA